MAPEWIHIGLTVVLAVIGWLNLLQTTKVKLEIANLKVWAMDRFVSKSDFLDTVGLFNETPGQPQVRRQTR